MRFVVTYLMDQLAPSETFIQRELEQLRKRDWPLEICLLKGGPHPLLFAAFSCPRGFRLRFIKAAVARVLEELFRAPLVALDPPPQRQKARDLEPLAVSSKRLLAARLGHDRRPPHPVTHGDLDGWGFNWGCIGLTGLSHGGRPRFLEVHSPSSTLCRDRIHCS